MLDEPGALIRASTAAIVLGDDACAYRLADRAAGLARSTGRHQLVPQALELAATAQCALGRYEPALTTLIDALRLARATGQESLSSSLIAFMAVLAATLGDRHTCLTRIDEVRTSEAWAQGASRAAALVEWALSILALVDGRPADAMPRLFGLMREESGQGQLAIWIAAAPHLVEACVRAGDRSAARRALAIFEPWARNTHNSAWLALAERCCALVSDDPQRMVDHFNEALIHHQIAGAEFERARTQLLFGQELRRGRRPGAAREHLQAAHDVFARFEATPLLAQASAELRAAGVRVAPRQARRPAAVLTAQQLQIARMAAGGATNREVAAALFISTRTVDYHMRNILSRLGVRSRVDLAKVLGDATAA